jgi:glycosyltransferase involved in cell wall biosynthesis
MTEKPLVSVIMNCFNGEKYLREAIDSVLAQTYQNWELIFWDNQSTDGSAEIVRRYNDPRIYYFYAPQHTLLYEARNYTIERSKGEFLAFLDVDDWWEPNKLSLQVPYFEDKTVGLVCGNYEVFYEESNWSRPQWTGQKPSGFIINELLADYHIGLLTILLRRSAYERLGGFDSRYHIIGDFDISLRVAESWEIKTLNQPVAHFRMHGANESIKRRKLHLEELRKWSEEAKIRLPESVLPSIKSLEKLILYLEGKNAVEAGNFLITLQRLKSLFPSNLCLKLFLITMLPHPIINWFQKIKYSG